MESKYTAGHMANCACWHCTEGRLGARVKELEAQRRGWEIRAQSDWAVRQQLEARLAALVALFAKRRLSDDKTILNDMEVAAVLLERHSGQIGFGLGRGFKKWIKRARKAVDAAQGENTP